MLLLFVTAVFARDVELKVHDMKGGVTGEVTVELGDPGQEPVRFVAKDDGVAPDAIAGDHLFTARAEGLAVEHGSVVVKAGDQKWEGGFQFDAQSDPVLLIGLEESGFAAASTREVMFVPQDRMPAPGADGAPPPGGMPGGAPPPGGTGAPPPGGAGMMPGGAVPPGGDAVAPGVGGSDGNARAHTGLPEGMWTGWGLAVVAVGGLGAVAWAAARKRAGAEERFETRAARGAWTPAPDRTDLFVGPGRGLAMGEGRWTPAEVALAARRVRGPARVVVTAPDRLDADGDGYAALVLALQGVADLLWVEPAGR